MRLLSQARLSHVTTDSQGPRCLSKKRGTCLLTSRDRHRQAPWKNAFNTPPSGRASSAVFHSKLAVSSRTAAEATQNYYSNLLSQLSLISSPLFLVLLFVRNLLQMFRSNHPWRGNFVSHRRFGNNKTARHWRHWYLYRQRISRPPGIPEAPIQPCLQRKMGNITIAFVFPSPNFQKRFRCLELIQFPLPPAEW